MQDLGFDSDPTILTQKDNTMVDLINLKFLWVVVIILYITPYCNQLNNIKPN